MDLAKCTLCFPNRTDSGTLSGGSWNASFPLTNLQNQVFKKKARTTNLTAANTTLTLALATSRFLSAVALASHNMTSTATWRIRVYEDVAQTTLLHDSGYQVVWPTVYSSDDVEWEFDNFWTGTPGDAELASFTPLAVYFFPATYIGKSVLVDLSDSTNTAGYIEAGRLFVSDAWQPTYNIPLGAETSYEDETIIDKALDGTKYFDTRSPTRVFKFQIDVMSADEAYNQISLMHRTLGKSGEVLVAYDLNQNAQFFLRTFIGTLGELSAVSQPYFQLFSNQVLIQEKI